MSIVYSYTNVVPFKGFSNEGNFEEIYTFWDSGLNITIVTQSIADKLGLDGPLKVMELNSAKHQETCHYKCVDFYIHVLNKIQLII